VAGDDGEDDLHSHVDRAGAIGELRAVEEILE
jgi:hypothetical protein